MADDLVQTHLAKMRRVSATDDRSRESAIANRAGKPVERVHEADDPGQRHELPTLRPQRFCGFASALEHRADLVSGRAGTARVQGLPEMYYAINRDIRPSTYPDGRTFQTA